MIFLKEQFKSQIVKLVGTFKQVGILSCETNNSLLTLDYAVC